MTVPRSNVRVCTNVHIRMPGIEARDDVGFKSALRTREAILALNPWIKTAVGIDWAVARGALTEVQLDVLGNHFACPICKRWDRWPVSSETGWTLSRTQFGCLCSHARDAERIDVPRV